MDLTLVFVGLAAVAFFVLVYFLVNAAGTRLTGKQIDEDPDVRAKAAPDERTKDYPIDTEL